MFVQTLVSESDISLNYNFAFKKNKNDDFKCQIVSEPRAAAHFINFGTFRNKRIMSK